MRATQYEQRVVSIILFRRLKKAGIVNSKGFGDKKLDVCYRNTYYITRGSVE